MSGPKSLIVFFKRGIACKYFILLKLGSLKSFIFERKSGDIILTLNFLYFSIKLFSGLNKLNSFISNSFEDSDSTHLIVWMELASDKNIIFNFLLFNN